MIDSSLELNGNYTTHEHRFRVNSVSQNRANLLCGLF